MGVLPLMLIVAAAFLIVVGLLRRRGRTLSARATTVFALVTATAVVLAVVLVPSSRKPAAWHYIHGSDTAVVTAAATDLHAPPAFTRRQARCRFALGAGLSMCFTTPRSVVLGRREMGRLVATTGARPQAALGGGLKCFGPANDTGPSPSRRRFALEQCAETATSGPLLLDVIATSVVRLTPTAVESTGHSLPGYFRGTQLVVLVVAVRQQS